MGTKKKYFTIKKGLKLLWIAYAIFSIMIVLPMVDRLLCKDYAEVSKYISLDDGWEIEVNGSVYQNISLENLQFEPVNKGDRIIMQRMLPEDWDIVEGVLRIHIRKAAVRIYIEDEPVYEYGYDRMLQNKTVGSGFQFVNISEQYKGKRLKMELYVLENQAFTRLDSIRFYEGENAYRALVTENRVPMFVGSFLAIFGLVVLMITLFAVVLSPKYIKIFCVALFSICMGLWTLCYHNVILVYAIPLYSVSLMEYMALYLSPMPLIIYMRENVRKLKSKILNAIYWILFAIQLLFDVVIITLHTMDILHCAAVIKYFQVLIVIELIYFTFVLIMNLRFSGIVNRLYLIGMLIIAGCAGYDIISYYYNRYLGLSYLPLKGVSSIGILIFIFILLCTFYINLTEKIMQEAERNSLIKSAYTDDLTQLSNRRYCSEYMQKVNNEQISDYAVVCFDLNNLKVTNDTYGHAKGDLLIKSAADVILETFGACGVVGRMGGDEFIAILKTAYKEEIENLLKKFCTNMARKNQEEPELNLSISYGYASSNEAAEKKIEKIYQIADDRMYANKKEYKRKNGNTKK